MIIDQAQVLSEFQKHEFEWENGDHTRLLVLFAGESEQDRAVGSKSKVLRGRLGAPASGKRQIRVGWSLRMKKKASLRLNWVSVVVV
jgi:hypothetical protein